VQTGQLSQELVGNGRVWAKPPGQEVLRVRAKRQFGARRSRGTTDAPACCGSNSSRDGLREECLIDAAISLPYDPCEPPVMRAL
jgi:hypothetical protein